MGYLIFLFKIILLFASLLLMALPFAAEFSTFKRDNNKKISYKRFKTLVYTAIYIFAVTILLYVLKGVISGIGSLSFVKWLASKLAVSDRIAYFSKVIAAVLVNTGVGVLYCLICKFVRIGIKKDNTGKKKKSKAKAPKIGADGKTREERIKDFEKKIIKFFHKEIWFFVGKMLKYLSVSLSVLYALLFIIYQLPAMFGAGWIPYNFISMIFESGYIYPTITLLGFWQTYFFLEGIRLVEEQCPELLSGEQSREAENPISVDDIDAEVKKQFKNHYVCDVDVSNILEGKTVSSKHSKITNFIGRAVENDKRNPKVCKEAYLDCIDKLVEEDKNVIINGSLFSEFSMYFLRYISIILARGDNVVVVCNTQAQIEEAYEYLIDGLSQISSIYFNGAENEDINFDDPIWRVVKVSEERRGADDASINDNNILVTSLGYLCSERFEHEYKDYISKIDTVIFIDTVKTINTYSRRLAILNTRLKHITENNARIAMTEHVGTMAKFRYMSRRIRYICFDDTRTPGVDKVLKNVMAVNFDSVDAMVYEPKTLVRCYTYEEKGEADDGSLRLLDSDEEIGALMNTVVFCLSKGASEVTVFARDNIPYEDLMESLLANKEQFKVSFDEHCIRLNKSKFNPDGYSVIIGMDSGNNLPASLRHYMSMVSDKPTLVMVFSKPYMLRDYYLSRIDQLWHNEQIERIPVEEDTEKDIVQKILVKANSGGISYDEIKNIVSVIPEFYEYVEDDDIDAILRKIIEIYGISKEDRLYLYKYFEYFSFHDFIEDGTYISQDRVVMRRSGKLFDIVNGRDMAVMCANTGEFVLPLPKSRLTQNYIAGQNLLYNGKIYTINRIDTVSGKIYTRLAVSGNNDEVYTYIQDRDYYVYISPEVIEHTAATKHIFIRREENGIRVEDAFISTFRAPTEVVTKGYFDVDPQTMRFNCTDSEYHSISDSGNDSLSKQSYRRYGSMQQFIYSCERDMNASGLISKGAMMMSVRIRGDFGPDINKTVALACTMLNEIISSMFPSVADSVVVCPIYCGDPCQDEESEAILAMQPRVTLIGENEVISSGDFEFLIIEDSRRDLGVISVLMSSGINILKTLFKQIFNYLNWYFDSGRNSDYLYYSTAHEPSCFDFESLYKLSKLLGGDKYKIKRTDVEELKTITEFDVCDFCGKKVPKGVGITELEDGRKMCKDCAASIISDDPAVLEETLKQIKNYIESVYGIKCDDDYDFCFESTVKIANTLKQNKELMKRSSDIPLKAYIEGGSVFVERDVPSFSLKEILVRELTYTWQLKHLPNLSEELAEGQIAVVSVQYLRFIGEDDVAMARVTYYETTDNISGVGYRRLAKELLDNPKYLNNPFSYLLGVNGLDDTDNDTKNNDPARKNTGEKKSDPVYGLAYTPAVYDRMPEKDVPYFYYSRLSDSDKGLYDIVLDAVANHKSSVSVCGYSYEMLCRVYKYVLKDHPEIFWFKTFQHYSDGRVEFVYTVDADECEAIMKRIEPAVNEYLADIDDSMSAYDVALRMHIRLINTVDYDTVSLERERGNTDNMNVLGSILGVFMNKKSICAGYSKAMQYLLRKCGVECAYVVGYCPVNGVLPDVAHAWNIVKLDSDYYYIDTTWDDSSNTIQKVRDTSVKLRYFCITTEELLRSRVIDEKTVEIPLCTATRCNYFVHNGLLIDGEYEDIFKSEAARAAANGKDCFEVKFGNKALLDAALDVFKNNPGKLFEISCAEANKVDSRIAPDTCSYSYNKEIYTVFIKFTYL